MKRGKCLLVLLIGLTLLVVLFNYNTNVGNSKNIKSNDVSNENYHYVGLVDDDDKDGFIPISFR